MEREATANGTTLAFRNFILASATSGFLLMSIIDAVVTYFLIDEATYITEIFQLFSLPHYTIAIVLILAELTTITLLIAMWASLFHPRSSIWKTTIAMMGSLGIIILCLIFGMSLICAHSSSYTNPSDFRKGIVKYSLDVRMTEGIEVIQSKLQCCGIDNYEDWRYSRDFVCATSVGPFKCGIPNSCCKQYVVGKSKIKDRICGIASKIVKSENGYVAKVYIATPNTTQITPEDIMYTDGCYVKIKQGIHDSSARLLVFAIILLLTQSFSIAVNYYAIRYLKTMMPISRERRVHYHVNTSVVNLEQPESQKDRKQPDIDNFDMVPIRNPRNLELGAACSLHDDGIVDSGKDKDDSADVNKTNVVDEYFQPVFARIASMAKEEGATCSGYNDVDHLNDMSVSGNDKVKPVYGKKSSIHMEYYEPVICSNVNPFEDGTDRKKGSDALGYYQPMMPRVAKNALGKKPEGKKRKVSFAK